MGSVHSQHIDISTIYIVKSCDQLSMLCPQMICHNPLSGHVLSHYPLYILLEFERDEAKTRIACAEAASKRATPFSSAVYLCHYILNASHIGYTHCEIVGALCHDCTPLPPRSSHYPPRVHMLVVISPELFARF